jgi:DNA-binding NtrC family response regulator
MVGSFLMKILYLEDHEFFASEVIEYLEEEGHEVHFASSYQQAIDALKKEEKFDCSFLDVILQNGKTGVLFANEFGPQLGRVMFITGCPDKMTLNAIKEYSSASKSYSIWEPIETFMEGGSPHIES